MMEVNRKVLETLGCSTHHWTGANFQVTTYNCKATASRSLQDAFERVGTHRKLEFNKVSCVPLVVRFVAKIVCVLIRL